ncbi:MAG: HU family DNA-binding protein [Candidatus Fervidibacter sp.]|uniref:HU family DNA-binding protein n=1 Tax=Candidatus Fervidibacter sp. TaxID=3100871 RepID=UPI004049B1D6
MTKAQLAAEVAKKTGLTKKQAADVVDAVFNTIVEVLTRKRNSEPVNIAGFGKFVVKVRPKRVVRNPRTGETIEKPETKLPAFRPAKQLKEAVAGK